MSLPYLGNINPKIPAGVQFTLFLILLCVLFFGFMYKANKAIGQINQISSSNQPSVSYPMSGMLREQAVLIHGIAVTKGTKMNALAFYPLGQSTIAGVGMRIHAVSLNDANLQLNELRGNSSNSYIFSTAELSYKGRYISLVLGPVEKTPGKQITFSFIIHTNAGDYVLRYVNGPLNLQGWWNGGYYGSLQPQSSYLIDLSQIFGFDNRIEHELKRIIIVIQNDTNVKSMLFGLSLGVSTRDNSTLLDTTKQYYVDGTIERYLSNKTDLGYTVHDASIFKKMSFMIRDVPDLLTVNSNGWNILSSQGMPSSGHRMNNTLALVAEKKTSILNSFPSVFLRLDILGSLAAMNQRDVLLAGMALVSILCFMLQSDCMNFIWNRRNFR